MHRKLWARLLSCVVALSLVLAAVPKPAQAVYYVVGDGGSYALMEYFRHRWPDAGYKLWTDYPQEFRAIISNGGNAFTNYSQRWVGMDYLIGKYGVQEPEDMGTNSADVLSQLNAARQAFDNAWAQYQETNKPYQPGGIGGGSGVTGGGGGGSESSSGVGYVEQDGNYYNLKFPVYFSSNTASNWYFNFNGEKYYYNSYDGTKIGSLVTVKITKAFYDFLVALPNCTVFLYCGSNPRLYIVQNALGSGSNLTYPLWQENYNSNFTDGMRYILFPDMTWREQVVDIYIYDTYNNDNPVFYRYIDSVSFSSQSLVNSDKVKPSFGASTNPAISVIYLSGPNAGNVGDSGGGSTGGTVNPVPDPSTIEKPESPVSPTNPQTPERESPTIVIGGTTQTVPDPSPAPDLSTIEDLLRRILANTNTIIEQMNSFASQLGQELADFYDMVYDWFARLDSWLDQLQAQMTRQLAWDDSFFDWMKAIDSDIQYLQSVCQNGFNDVTSWLQNIFNRMVQGNGGGSKPGIVDPTDPSPVTDWLRQLWTSFLADLQMVLPNQVGAVVDFLDQLRQKFPFSIPWDIAAMLALLNHAPVTPVIDIPWGYAGHVQSIHVDCHAWDDAVELVRPMFLLLFALGLALLTRELLAGLEAVL